MRAVLFYLGCGIAGLIMMIILYRKFRFFKQCPSCGYDDPDRIPRKGLMKRLPLKAYFCPACRHRFYVFNLFTEEPESHSLLEWNGQSGAVEKKNKESVAWQGN
ncbi:hypothetical protein WBJ53_04735 [Spirosoma sp. SC4-14]|uniref:hypothetical protein n=1 Tax=Spirosoma sp. SC4-14 TaxID=3128900 RepID=UPI0030CC366D